MPTDQKITEPKIVRKEFDGSHYYWVNDEYYPAVTAILDQAAPFGYGLRNFLLNNTQESADEIKKEATGLGSLMHDAYQNLLLGNELDLAKDYPEAKKKKHIMSFHKWFYTFQPDVKTIQTEHTVASLKYKYAGTLDLAVRKEKELWIIDFKTSSGIYPSYEMQLAAYKQAYEETHQTKVDHIAILRTGTRHKDGYEFKEITTPIEQFINVYNTYLWLNGGKIPDPPVIDIYPEKVKLFE